jgi:hypothetical protein
LGVDVVDEFQYAFLEIEMFFMIGCVLGPLSGISVFASDEKADWNCLFKILFFFLLDLHVRLTIIYKKSVETGKVPLDWNHANVAPVCKKGDKQHPVNYRPISLTCISCKL